MKNYFLLAAGILFLSSCSQDFVGDSLFYDTTFEKLNTADHIDCFGQCTIKIHNP